MLYKFDLNRLTLQMLPPLFRQHLIFGILRAAVTGLQHVYDLFLNTRTNNVFRMTHNGQVCYLRGALNAKFKSQYGTFHILTIERVGEWLYAVNETGEHIPVAAAEDVKDDNGQYQDDGLTVPVVYNELAIEPEANNFIVSVPADLFNTCLSDIKALVNNYKLPTKKAIYMAQS